MIIRSRTPNAFVAVTLLLLACTSNAQLLPVAQLDATDLQTPELWYGVIKTPAVWLRTAIYLTQTNGKWSGYSISLDQGAAKIPVSSVHRHDDQWTVEFKSVDAVFVGREAEDHGSVEGTFTQNGKPFPLQLQRLEKLPPLPADQVYRGELNAIIRKLAMQMRVIKGKKVDSKQLVLIDSLSEGFLSFVGTLEQVGSERVLNVPILKAQWKGSITEDDKVWSGTWRQGIIPLPLQWRLEESPLDAASFQVKRPQKPKLPLPYEARQVGWTNDAQPNVKLAGTLTLPKRDVKLPAVIMLSGSGPQDRDETIANHKPFLVIADYLSRNGYAVLRYDDRGTAASSGDFRAAVTDDFVSDALSAWDFLAAQPEIDSAKIGYLGHSEGSSVAISASQQNSNISFLILMAGAGWNGQKIAVEQTLEMARRQGMSQESLNALQKLMEGHSRLVLEHTDTPEFTAQIDELVTEYLDSEGTVDQARETTQLVLGDRLKELNSNWYRDFLARDPTDDLSHVAIPWLAVWGSEDVQVPATGNRDAMQAALERSPKHALTRLEILPGLNHLLQPCKTGLIDEYDEIEITISPLALEKFAEFLRNVTAE